MKPVISAFIIALLGIMPALACGASAEPEPTATTRVQPTARPTVASLNQIPTSHVTPTTVLTAGATKPTPDAGQHNTPTNPAPSPTAEVPDDQGTTNPSAPAIQTPSPTATEAPTPTPADTVAPTPTASDVVLIAPPTSTPVPTPTPAPPPTPSPTPVYYSTQFSEADYRRVQDRLPPTPQAEDEQYCFSPLPLIDGRFTKRTITRDSTPEGIKGTPNYQHIMAFAYGLDEGETIYNNDLHKQPYLLATEYQKVVARWYQSTIGYEGKLRLDGCAQIEVMDPVVPIIRYLWSFDTYIFHEGEATKDLWFLHAYFIVENDVEASTSQRNRYKVRLIDNQVNGRPTDDPCELPMPIGTSSCPR